jgi:hypothetical protein
LKFKILNFQTTLNVYMVNTKVVVADAIYKFIDDIWFGSIYILKYVL